MDRPHYISPVGHCGRRNCSGNTEISNLNVTIIHNQNVMGLNVTMHQIILVGSLQGTGQFLGYAGSLLRLQIALFLNIFLEGFASHIFHNNKMTAFIFPYIIYINDILMGELGCTLGLTMEFLYEFSIIGKLRMKDFYSNSTVQQLIMGSVYISHAAATDMFLNFITSC